MRAYGALFLIALLAKRRVSPNYKLRVERKDLLTLFALALMGVTFFFTIQYIGIPLAGASIAAILVCLLSPIAGTLLGVSTDLLNLEGSRESLVGTLILLSTPVMWAAYSMLGQKIMQKYDAFLVVSYVSLSVDYA